MDIFLGAKLQVVCVAINGLPAWYEWYQLLLLLSLVSKIGLSVILEQWNLIIQTIVYKKFLVASEFSNTLIIQSPALIYSNNTVTCLNILKIIDWCRSLVD